MKRIFSSPFGLFSKFSTCFTVLMVSVCLTAAGSAPAASPFRTPQRWALLVGVNEYANVQSLRYCVADQESLAKQFVAAGFPSDQVYMLGDSAKQQKYRPSKLNIEKQLELVLGMPSEGDTLVLSFSGHGVQINGKSYICPSDCEIEHPQESMISLDRVFNELSACKASLKLLIVDACRNNVEIGGKRSLDNARSLRAFGEALEKPPEGISLLTSCSPGEFAREHDKLGHGVFIHFVLQGLQGQAADDDGIVRVGRLLDYTCINTKKYVHDQFNAAQRPAYKLEGSGPMELVHIERPIAAPPALDAPFGAQTAVQGQVAWAKYLKRGVAETNSLGMQMKLIPPGQYMMGSPNNEENHYYDETLHQVRINKPFYLGTYTVTLGQFLAFRTDAEANYQCEVESNGIGGLGYTGRRDGNDPFQLSPNYVPWSWGHREETNSLDCNYPVVNIGWYDAVAFCKWLSKKEGKTYRLPTEAEWEYACRAGTTTRFYFGDDKEQILYYGNAGDQSLKRENPWFRWGISGDDGYAFSAPVGMFRPNAFGLYDMHGNVTQWCNDWYSPDYFSRSPVDDPTGPAAGSIHVIRGGCWLNDAQYCRSANRYYTEIPKWRCLHGFRIVCEVE